jgi:hypothetical protein
MHGVSWPHGHAGIRWHFLVSLPADPFAVGATFLFDSCGEGRRGGYRQSARPSFSGSGVCLCPQQPHIVRWWPPQPRPDRIAPGGGHREPAGRRYARRHDARAETAVRCSRLGSSPNWCQAVPAGCQVLGDRPRERRHAALSYEPGSLLDAGGCWSRRVGHPQCRATGDGDDDRRESTAPRSRSPGAHLRRVRGLEGGRRRGAAGFGDSTPSSVASGAGRRLIRPIRPRPALAVGTLPSISWQLLGEVDQARLHGRDEGVQGRTCAELPHHVLDVRPHGVDGDPHLPGSLVEG